MNISRIKFLLSGVAITFFTMFSLPAEAIDPVEVAKLLANDAESLDFLGYSVAVDGDTAVIGAPYEDFNGRQNNGAAYVFVRSGGEWSQQAKLLAGDYADMDYFGYAVAVVGDTAVIGAPLEDDGDTGSGLYTFAGAAYVFSRTGTSWEQQAKLVASDRESDSYFGSDVAVDGDTAIIGAYREDSDATDNGAAYVFTRSGVTWAQQAKLLADDRAAREYFGWSVALDGDTAVVGASRSSDSGTGLNGAAYVFIRVGTIWTKQAKLLASNKAYADYFGSSVDIDRDTIIVGAYNKRRSLSYGVAYIFVRSSSVWSEQQMLAGGNGVDAFGSSVAVDGDVAVIAAPRERDVVYLGGVVYIYARTDSVWTRQARLVASDRARYDYFGRGPNGVDISTNTVVIGAPLNDDGGSASGSAYVFSLRSNQSPVADAGGPYTADEGSPISVDGTSSNDPDGDPLTYSWEVDSPDCTFVDATSAATTVSCVDNGSSTLTLTVSDGTDVASDIADLQVLNVAPTVIITAPAEGSVIPIYDAVQVTGTVSDPGIADAHTCQIKWGDGNSNNLYCDTAAGITSSPYPYGEAGVYTMQVTATDDDNGTDTRSVMIVVYDVSAGFVTGGGWIDSPDGAYKPDPTLTGKANFGFVSRYKKGATRPTGQTQFVFQAGGLNFHSDDYEWLVVNQGGSNAQYKGTGLINGQTGPNGSPYGFMMWAGDGGSAEASTDDTFRIRIWYEENGSETDIYDNGKAQPLSGGSIIINTGG